MSDTTKHEGASNVTVDRVGERIARVRFANPARRHALDAPLLDALVAHLDALAEHRPPPVVILSNDGSGDVWSAGTTCANWPTIAIRSPTASRSNGRCGACAPIRAW